MPPDPRDDVLIAAIVAGTTGMIRAAAYREPQVFVDHLVRLATAIIEHSPSLSERPSDEQLRRAVARLCA